MELSKLKFDNNDRSSVNILESKITTREAKIGIIGIGYVGEALAKTIVSTGFQTLGYDLNKEKLTSINHSLFIASKSVNELEDCDVICICVPTPLDINKKPDLGFLDLASRDVAKFQKRNQLVIIESTVAPGTLRHHTLPILESNGRKSGRDFYLAVSPERVDPGNTHYNLKNTPKVVGGIDGVSLKLASTFYAKFIDKVIITSSAEIAEFTKVMENTFRLVNISLVNELNIYAKSVGIDIWEVINTAATKPFAFMPHYPGPGVGGHCIPVDPVYLYEEAKSNGVSLDILGAAIKVNQTQPSKVVAEAKKILNNYTNGKRAKMLVIGIAYKPESNDIRESPAVKIIEEAEEEGFEVIYFDPFVPKLNGYSSHVLSKELLLQQDVIVIATHHKSIQYELIKESGVPVIDTRNVLKKLDKNNSALIEELTS